MKFMDDILLNPQRIHHHIIAPMELNEVKSAKCSRILILVSAVYPQVNPLHLISQVSHGIRVHHDSFPPRHGHQHGHHDSG